MFETFKRSMAAQRAGYDAAKKVMFVAWSASGEICRELEQRVAWQFTLHPDATARLLSVYFFDYLVQNVAAKEVASALSEANKNDLGSFLSGAERAMRENSAFGSIGFKLQDIFLDRCSEMKTRTSGAVVGDAYAELVGSWFCDGLEIQVDRETAILVGEILRNHARRLFIP